MNANDHTVLMCGGTMGIIVAHYAPDKQIVISNDNGDISLLDYSEARWDEYTEAALELLDGEYPGWRD